MKKQDKDIVRAYGNIRLSNQLAEVGIGVREWLSEGLGFGATDEGMAEFMKYAENTGVGANKALEIIMSKMEETYGGMMDKMSKTTVSGLKSNIKDTFEIKLFRKWGQGLQDGALKGFGAFADYLDENEKGLDVLGNKLYDFAKVLSNDVAQAAQRAGESLLKVTDTQAFNDASLFGKIGIAWDEVIGKPFSEWWAKKGPEMSRSIGEGLGKGAGGIINGLLGIVGGGSSELVDGAKSAGSSFADGFIQGFQPSKVGENIKSALSNVFKGSHFNLFGGGGEKSILNDMLMLWGIGKVTPLIKGAGALIGGGTKAVKGGMNTFDKGKGLFNRFTDFMFGRQSAGAAETAASVLGGAAPAMSVATITANTIMAGSLTAPGAGLSPATVGVGKATTATAAGKATGAAVAGKAALSSTFVTGATVAGIVSAGAGLVSAGKDLVKGANDVNKKNKQDSYAKAGTKAGMVGVGAALGAGIGSIVPVVGTALGAALGAGLGGLGAIFAGGKLGQTFSDMADGTSQIRRASEDLSKSRSKLEETTKQDLSVNSLISEYEGLNSKVKDGNITVDERKATQEQINGVVRELAKFYPTLIGQYDIEHGKISANLELLKEMSAVDKKRAYYDAKNDIATSRQKFTENNPLDKIAKSDEQINSDVGKIKQIENVYDQAANIQGEIIKLNSEYQGKAEDSEYYNRYDSLMELGGETRAAYDKKYAGTTPTSDGYDEFFTKLSAEYEKYTKSVGDEEQRKSEQYTSMQNYAQSLKNIAEYDANPKTSETLESRAGRFWQSAEEDKEVFRSIINDVTQGITDAFGAVTSEQMDMIFDRAGLDELMSESSGKRDQSLNAYNAKKKELEAGLGSSFYALSENYSKLDSEQKAAFDTAKQSLLEYAATLNGLPDGMITDVYITKPSAAEKSAAYPTHGMLRMDEPTYHANGGILTRPHVGMVAEDGAEAVIPLSASKRGRGLAVWQRAGQLMGVAHADGGVFGGTSYIPDSGSNYTVSNESMQPISIDVGGMQFVIDGANGGDSGDIMNALRQQMPEVANELCATIAGMLKKTFTNMSIVQS